MPTADPLAGRDQARHGRQRYRRARGHAADAARRRRRARRQGGAAARARRRRPDLQGPSRRLRPRCPRSRARRTGRARSSSTGPTTAASRRCATTTGRSPSWSRRREGLDVWQEPFVELRAPKLTNLRMDPFERAEAEDAMGYQRWYIERMFADRARRRLRRRSGCRASGVPAAPEARQLQPRPRDGGGDGWFPRQPMTPT